jgi:predicted transcriptional regulator
MTENNSLAAADVCCTHPDELTTTIVSAYVSNNSVPKNDLPDLIKSVRSAITGGSPAPAAIQSSGKMPTSAEIKKSVTPDALISFLDGRSYKTLKRHLGTHGFTPESYRAAYGLGADYPMVAPNYSEKRSQLAISLGLGSQRRKPAA